jgi:hypothetical protein
LDLLAPACEAILTALLAGGSTPDDPSEAIGSEILTTAFSDLSGVASELIFIRANDNKRMRMALHDAADGPWVLRDFVGGRHAALLAGRFDALCEAHDVRALVLSTDIPAKTLDRFVTDFARLVGGDSGDGDLSERLLDDGIVDAAVIFGRDWPTYQGLPWRVALALGRLTWAVRATPVFAGIRRVSPSVARRRLIAPIMSGLERGVGLVPMLAQLDEVLAGVTDVALHPALLDETAIVVAEHVQPHVRAQLARTLMDDMTRSTDDSQRSDAARSVRWLGRSLVQTFSQSPERQPASVTSLLGQLHSSGMLQRDDLPEPLQQGLAELDRKRAFLDRPLAFLQRIDEHTDAAEYRTDLVVMLSGFAELSPESRHVVAGHASRLLLEHRTSVAGFDGRRRVVDEVLSDLDDLGLRGALNRVLLSGAAEERFRAGELLLAMGSAAIPSFLSVLAQTDRPETVADVTRLLAKVAPPPWLADYLETSTLSATALLALLRVLSDRGRPEFADAAGRLIAHGDSRVRERAVEVVTELDGSTALPVALTAIEDTAPNVVCAALHSLEILDYDADEYGLTLLRLAVLDTGHHGNDRIRTAALDTLSRRRLTPDVATTIETSLLQMVENPPTKRWLRGRPEMKHSSLLRAALYRALGQVGGTETHRRLSVVAQSEPDATAREAARNALANLLSESRH